MVSTKRLSTQRWAQVIGCLTEGSSGCGAVKAKLPLSERTYVCAACGLVLDRDLNAARNLLKLAASGAERITPAEGR